MVLKSQEGGSAGKAKPDNLSSIPNSYRLPSDLHNFVIAHIHP